MQFWGRMEERGGEGGGERERERERESGESSLTGFSPRKVVLAVSLNGRLSMGSLWYSQMGAMASSAL